VREIEAELWATTKRGIIIRTRKMPGEGLQCCIAGLRDVDSDHVSTRAKRSVAATKVVRSLGGNQHLDGGTRLEREEGR
jgi:hypothetical protein